jgi:rhomboid protease GluP
MLKRKTSGSIVCPSCGRLVSVTARKCIHCGRLNPGLWGFGPELRRLLGQYSSLFPLVISVCVVLYMVSLFIDPSAIFQPRGIFDLLSPSMRALDRLGMTGNYALATGRWWTMITAIYLHGSLLHILFNMLWLRQLGQMVEELFGIARTFLIFTISGIVGFVVSNFMGVGFTIGASGAIFGLLAALIYYGRSRGGFFGAAIYRQVGIWALVMFLFGFMAPAVNNFAHAGGFIGGYLAAMLLGYHEKKPANALHSTLATFFIVLTLVAFALEIFILH